jgi:hypothetical protein
VRLYSDFGGRRAYQITGDVVAVVLVVLGIVLGVTIHDAIAALEGVGRDVERSGSDFSRSMTDIGDRLAGVPLIGPGISAPFDGARDAGGTLADAGAGWQAGVERVALLAGWTVAVLVVLVVLVGWVRPRLVGAVRRASAARLASAAADRDLLALRALTTRPARALTRIDADVVGAWRRGDAAVIRDLAALELRASGVRLQDDGVRPRQPAR